MERAEILRQNGYDFLWIRDGSGKPDLWMWDVPTEVRAQKQIADQAWGEVLVAGYGLGLVQKLLLENPKVTRVVTCEIEPQVVKANKKRYGKLWGEVVLGDFYRFSSQKKFDCVIGDIWLDIMPEYLGDYLAFRKKAQSLVKKGGKILGWGLDYFEYKLKNLKGGENELRN